MPSCRPKLKESPCGLLVVTQCTDNEFSERAVSRPLITAPAARLRVLKGSVAIALLAGLSGLPVTAAIDRGEASADPHYLMELAQRINGFRLANGLAPLAPADELVALASQHSRSMDSHRELSHQGFRQRYARAGSRVCVENLGWNYPTPEGLMEGWQGSPAHLRNLLEPRVARMGLAASGDYVTFFACR